MPAPSSVDRQTFLGYLRQSRLLSEDQIGTMLAQMPSTNRGRVIARALVDAGLLTRFQAERLLAGRTQGFLVGPYRILDQVGRGGMGRVYKAEHATMKRLVALKILAPALLQSERARQLFQHEVQASARLAHPHIVTAYDASIEESLSYLVLEYVDGPSLDQLVRQRGPLPVGLACDYMRQAAHGLQCAHLLGMVHRDIKPSNILVQRRGMGPQAPGLVKISDFGLARLFSPETSRNLSHPGTLFIKENTIMGTPDFLSPEQARCLHQTDIRSDLYSLGCTFYFLLTGQVPFPGGSPVDKILRHSTEKPVPLLDLRSDVPPGVAAIVETLLARHPEDRLQTPQELADLLQPFSVSSPTPWDGACTPADVSAGDAATPLGDLATSPQVLTDGPSSDELPAAPPPPAAPGSAELLSFPAPPIVFTPHRKQWAIFGLILALILVLVALLTMLLQVVRD